MRRAAVLLLIFFVLGQCRAEDEHSVWANATSNLGESEWVKDGVWKVVAVPGTKDVVGSMMGLGLWSTSDGGVNWKRMGQEGQRPPNEGQAVQFVFDPKNPKQWWTSGMYNYAVWKTADGGVTFEKLGPHNHVDGIAVDFTDPERKTLVIGLHEQERSLHKSTDGGKTWVKIGDKLPEKSSFSTDPIIIDSKTYLTSGAGWKQGLPWGIYRTEDGGETWSKVSDAGAAGNPLVTADGTIYWSVFWDGALIKSSDHGKTWARVPGPVRGLPIELPGNRLVGTKDSQLYVSGDGGKTWSAFGEPLPFKPSGLTYSDGLNSIFAYVSNTKSTKAVVRWDLPKDLEAAFKMAVPGHLVVYDGEGFSAGGGWASSGFVRPQNKEKHSGNTALEYHVEAAEKWEGGFNWFNWAQTLLTDVSEFQNLSLSVKYSGVAKPSGLRIALNCGPNKISSAYLPLLDYCPDVFDGQWHEVRIPLKEFCQKKDFDPRNVYELRILAETTKENKLSLFIDDVLFEKSNP